MMKIVNTLLFTLLLSVASLGSGVRADPIPANCTQAGDYDAVTVLLVDRTVSAKDAQGFSQSIATLKGMIQPGERLVVAVIVDKVSSMKLLIDVVKPKSSMWESKLKHRKKVRQFANCLAAVEKSMLSKDIDYKTSAILETLAFTSQVIKSTDVAQKRVVVFSDMLQNSSSLTFYGKSLRPGTMIKKAARETLIKNFDGVQFYMAGTGGGVTDQKARKVEHFWKKYVVKSKGELKFYGPVLIGR